MTHRFRYSGLNCWAAGLLALASGISHAADPEPGTATAPAAPRLGVFSWQTAGPQLPAEAEVLPQAIKPLPPGAALTKAGIMDPWGDGLNLQAPPPKFARRTPAPAVAVVPKPEPPRPTITPHPKPVSLPVAKAQFPLTAGSQFQSPPRLAATPSVPTMPRYAARPEHGNHAQPSATLTQTPISRPRPEQPRLDRYSPAVAGRYGADRLDANSVPASDSALAQPPIADAVARMAKQHIDRGVDLADRRAFFSARDEFIQALRLIAEARDAETQSGTHSQSLAAALRALEEADEFMPTGSSLEADVDVRAIASSHRTPVLKIMPVRGISALAARQRYYTYAQEEFARAAARQPLASRALHSLGKLHTQAAEERTAMFAAAEPKAMACHQAALLADPKNPMAANELGVLLARYGRLEEARGWLEQSVAIAPQATTWHNLAIVHQRLGQVEFAEQAHRNSVAARQNPAAEPNSAVRVQWVKPEQFAAAVAGRGAVPRQAGLKPAAEASRRPNQVR